MEDEKDAPELDIIQDAKLPDEPDEAGEKVADETDEGNEDKAADAVDASQDDKTDDSGDDTTEDKPKKAEPKVQKRIDQLTKARHDAERRAERAETQLRARQEQPGTDLSAPDPSKYTSGDADPQYYADLAVFKAEQRREAGRVEASKRDEEVRKQDAAIEWQGKIAEASTRYDDYEVVALKSTLQVTQAMAEAIQASDVGADVLYWLGQNSAEARRISTLPSVRQAIEIGRIEAALESKTDSEPLPKKTTSAPDPATRLAGKVTPSKNPSKMSNEEYRIYRGKKTA